MHLSIVSTVCCSKGSRYTCEPPMEAACSDTDTVSERAIFPSSMASRIKSIVMIFVTLAGWSFSSSAFPISMVPVDTSIKSA